MSNMEETEKKTSSLYNSITERVNKLNLSDLQNKDNELDKSKLTQVRIIIIIYMYIIILYFIIYARKIVNYKLKNYIYNFLHLYTSK